MQGRNGQVDSHDVQERIRVHFTRAHGARLVSVRPLLESTSRSCKNIDQNMKQEFLWSTVKLLVGAVATKFTFHMNLCSIAPFFNAALQGDFQEAVESTIHKPEDIPSAVHRFQLWAYSGFPLTKSEAAKEIEYEDFIRLYLFAERYDMPDLQNATIDILVAKEKAAIDLPIDSMHLVDDNSPSKSPLRLLMVAWTSQHGALADHDWFGDETANERYPHAFLIDLSLALYRLQQGIVDRYDWTQLGCKLHVHPVKSSAS